MILLSNIEEAKEYFNTLIGTTIHQLLSLASGEQIQSTYTIIDVEVRQEYKMFACTLFVEGDGNETSLELYFKQEQK